MTDKGSLFFFSNRLEALYENMRESMFPTGEPSAPFTRRILITPNRAMTSWISLQLADDIGIAAGIERFFLFEGISHIKKHYLHNDLRAMPSVLTLAFRLEVEIKKIFSSSERTDEIWSPLFAYLGIRSSVVFSQKSERRLGALCHELSLLFERYGLYAGEMVALWEKSDQPEWQKRLWKRIFCGENALTYPSREYKRHTYEWHGSEDVQIHLFAFSFMPALQQRFFYEISSIVPVYQYVLSPCKFFWFDSKSDREVRGIERYWKKQGVSESQLHELEHYLRDTNPLLANFGRLGREMLTNVEEMSALSVENYIAPAGFVKSGRYDDDMPFSQVEMDHETPTLLKALQADMLFMCNPQKVEALHFERYDKTVQFHTAPSRMREVQILYNSLLELLDGGDLSSSDIIVMAPDIGTYIPAIKAIFGDSTSALHFQIADAATGGESDLIEAFLSLIRLAEARWDVEEIFHLFECKHFRATYDFSHDDIHCFRKWAHALKVQWGKDEEHRQNIMDREYGSGATMVEESNRLSWADFFHRLLKGLAVIDPKREFDVDLSNAELIGTLSLLLSTLYDDLEPLADGTAMSIVGWKDHLQNIFCRHFTIDQGDSSLVSDWKRINESFEMLAAAGDAIADELFVFPTVMRRLETMLVAQKADIRDSRGRGVVFCSMLPMRAVPAGIIALIGMEFDSYPRHDERQSLDMIASHEKVDYIPRRPDFDRYLFLEALLSARHAVYISCSGNGDDGGSPLPSLVIAELIDYMDTAYVIEGDTFSSRHIIHHPIQSYHHCYFDGEDERYINYSQEDYRISKRHYHEEKETPRHFVPALFGGAGEAAIEVTFSAVTIDDLAQVAKSPAKAYCNKTLGMYLSCDFGDADGEFELSGLEKYKAIKKVLHNEKEDILCDLYASKNLPLGAFKDVALQDVKEEIEKLEKNMKSLDSGVCFSITLDKRCSAVVRESETSWRVPALRVSVEGSLEVCIVGVLDSVTSHGFLFYGTDTIEDIIKVWPSYLVFSSIVKRDSLPCETALFCVRSGKELPAFLDDSMSLMESYIKYYRRCLGSCSPLLPSWIPSVVARDAEALYNKIASFLEGASHKRYRDIYVERVFAYNTVPDAESIVESWHADVAGAFGDVIAQWGNKRRNC